MINISKREESKIPSWAGDISGKRDSDSLPTPVLPSLRACIIEVTPFALEGSLVIFSLSSTRLTPYLTATIPSHIILLMQMAGESTLANAA